jgi:hypothetical protein
MAECLYFLFLSGCFCYYSLSSNGMMVQKSAADLDTEEQTTGREIHHLSVISIPVSPKARG